MYIETTPQDIEWGFRLLKETLLRKSDELSGALRSFYDWLKQWAAKNKLDKFYGSEVRKDNRIHPRTLQRYLSELAEYGYIQFIGGSKYKSVYQYGIEPGQGEAQLSASIDRQVQAVLDKIQAAQQQAPKPARTQGGKKKATVRQPATKADVSHPNPPQESLTA